MDLAGTVGISQACEVLDVARATLYRSLETRRRTTRRAVSPPWELGPEQRQEVLELLNSERFVDLAPAEVFHTLLDEGRYLCSVRTMYRILASHGLVRERRNQRRHPQYQRPELVATAPNQVWTWDITKLRSLAKFKFYYLFVMLDIFSRYVVGWMLAERETAALAEHLIQECCRREGVRPGQITIHSDRGPAMIASNTAQLLARLGCTRSLSRPHVSNDNPFSESQFKTLKYHPSFPNRFGCFEDGLSFSRSFFPWYNGEHYHSGIAFLTPETVHRGRAAIVLAERQATMDRAYLERPQQFPKGAPRVPQLPEAVWINPPRPTSEPTSTCLNCPSEVSQKA